MFSSQISIEKHETFLYFPFSSSHPSYQAGRHTLIIKDKGERIEERKRC
jgi:hypothetical protein